MSTIIPELRLFLDDGRDKFLYNLLIPKLDAPHHLAQVCVCGLARTYHYSTKKTNDKLGAGPKGKNNYYQGKRCQQFTWNPGYHECRLARQQRISGNKIIEGKIEIEYVKLDKLVHMVASKIHNRNRGLFLVFECLEETEDHTQLIKWEALDNHKVCTKCLGMFQIKHSERKSLEDFF